MYIKEDRIFPKIQKLDIFEDQVTNCGQNHCNVGEISRFQRSQRPYIEIIFIHWRTPVGPTLLSIAERCPLYGVATFLNTVFNTKIFVRCFKGARCIEVSVN